MKITTLDMELLKNEHEIWRGSPNLLVCIAETLFSKTIVFLLMIIGINFLYLELLKPLRSVPMFYNITQIFSLFIIIVTVAYLLFIIWKVCLKTVEVYIITNENIYIRTGIITSKTVAKPFAEISHYAIKQGIIDRIFGTADIVIDNGTYRKFQKATYIDGKIDEGLELSNLLEYRKIYNIIKEKER